MRKDLIVTPEEQKLKKSRLEENRRLTTGTLVSPTTISGSAETTQLTSDRSSLSAADWCCLHSISNAYLSACQSNPSASSMVSLELAPDRISAYMNTLDIQNYAAMKLITFLREIPEFVELDEGDRMILVKYNLTLLFVPRFALVFDAQRDLIYDEDQVKPSFTHDEEAFAQYCQSLHVLCYGYEFHLSFVSILRSLAELVDRDPIVVQLLMLTMIFLKGLSGNNDSRAAVERQSTRFPSSIEVHGFTLSIPSEAFVVARSSRDEDDAYRGSLDQGSTNPSRLSRESHREDRR